MTLHYDDYHTHVYWVTLHFAVNISPYRELSDAELRAVLLENLQMDYIPELTPDDIEYEFMHEVEDM